MSILSNIYFILVLRIAHIAGGVIWVGSAILYLFLLIPVARSAESAGQKFMQTLGPRFGKMMGIVTTVTVLSGALLYARYLEAGLAFMWTTHAGLAFAIGATVFGKTQEKIGALGAAMQSAGGPPKPEQLAEMNRLQAFLMKAYRIDFVLLVVAMTAMAVARYL